MVIATCNGQYTKLKFRARYIDYLLALNDIYYYFARVFKDI